MVTVINWLMLMIIPQREGENPVKKKKKIAHPDKQGEGRRDDQDQEGAGEVKKKVKMQTGD